MPERLNSAVALSSLDEADLRKMARVAHLLVTGQPAFGSGLRPHRTRAGQGTEFLDFQAYRPGEDIRRLDWRASARRGRPFVRTYHDELSTDWQLCLDRSASMGALDDSKWMLGVQLAAAFAYMLLHVGNRVGVVQFSSGIDNLCPLGRGRLQYLRIVEQLRHSKTDSHGGGSNLSSVTPVVKSGTHMVILGDFLRPDAMREDLRALRSPGRKIHAVQVLSSSETSVENTATSLVRDIESGELVAIEPGAGHLAQSKLERWQQNFKVFSAQNGIQLSSCSSTDRWQDVMLEHIALVTRA